MSIGQTQMKLVESLLRGSDLCISGVTLAMEFNGGKLGHPRMMHVPLSTDQNIRDTSQVR